MFAPPYFNRHSSGTKTPATNSDHAISLAPLTSDSAQQAMPCRNRAATQSRGTNNGIFHNRAHDLPVIVPQRFDTNLNSGNSHLPL